MGNQRSYRIIAVGSLIVAAGLGWGLFLCARQGNHSSPVTLPAEDEIKMMTATMDDSTQQMGIGPVAKFIIPPERYGIVLSALTPTEEFEYPAMWENMTFGRLQILTKGGKRVTIEYCEAGKNKLCFSVDGIRCIRGGEYRPTFITREEPLFEDESNIFYNILMGIHEENLSGKESDRLARAIQQLQRSKGEQPPERR